MSSEAPVDVGNLLKILTVDFKNFILLPYVLLNTYSLEQLVEDSTKKDVIDNVVNNRYLIISSAFQLFCILAVLNVVKYYVSNILEFLYVKIYDFAFGDLNFDLATPNLFMHVIEQLNPNSHVLDFGCGNGICYTNRRIKQIIESKNLKIHGIDINQAYIKKCIKRIKTMDLKKNVMAEYKDLFTLIIDKEADKYDYIVLSESAPLIDDELLNMMIKHMKDKLLKKDGQIIFINNLTENSSKFMVWIKPLFKYIISIDFGRILCRRNFENFAKQNDMNLKFELITKMSCYDIMKYFNVYFLSGILYLAGLKNYDVEQYQIIFTHNNNKKKN